MSANEEILKALLERGDYLARFSEEEVAAVLLILERAQEGILGKIASTKGPLTREWLAEVKRDIDAVYAAASRRIGKTLTTDLRAFAKEEAAWTAAEFEKLAVGVSFTAPAAGQLWATIAALPAAEGSTLGQLAEALGLSGSVKMTEAIQAGMSEGETIQQLTRRIRGEVVKRASWKTIAGKRRYVPGVYRDGVFETTTREAETLARTAVAHVSNQAREAFYAENAGLIKGFKRVETLDGDTCLICGADDGHVYGPDDPRPQLPEHPRCLTGDALVSSGSRVSAVSKREYKGDVFVIRTAAGKQIRATPNHPILTDRGFIPAKDINLGDDLVCDAGIDRVLLGGENKEYVESSFEKLFCSFLKSSEMAAVLVPTSAEDFHGDGADNEVAIVARNGELLNKTNSSIFEKISKGLLVFRRRENVFNEARPRGLLQGGFGVWLSLLGFMSRFCEALALLGARTAHSFELLFVPIPGLYPRICKDFENVSPSSPERVGYPAHANASVVKGENGVKAGADLSAPPASLKDYAQRSEGATNSIFGYTVLARQLLDGLAGPVALDKIVEIRKDYFSGHVYNLQSEKGWFIANGIITHNCRGVYVPVTKSWRELGINREELPASTRASMDGQVPENETFDDRLAKMAPKRQDAVLGPTRGRLYREGVPLVDMVAGGKVIPLAKLGKGRRSAA